MEDSKAQGSDLYILLDGKGGSVEEVVVFTAGLESLVPSKAEEDRADTALKEAAWEMF